VIEQFWWAPGIYPSQTKTKSHACLTLFHRSHFLDVIVWLRPAKKRYTAAPPLAGVRRRMERNRQKLVGRDKGSLTEQQTKGTGTTKIQIRRKHNINRTTQRAALPNCSHRVLPRLD